MKDDRESCHFRRSVTYISTRVSRNFSQHVILRQYFMFYPPLIQRIHIKKEVPYLRVSNKSFRGIWNAYSVFHFSATEPARPSLQFASGIPDRNDKLYFLWSSLFFATFYLPLWTLPLPHLLLSYRLIIPPPHVPSGPRDTLPLTLFQTTHRNGIKSTCQNVFHLIHLTLLYDTQDLLSGVAQPSDAVLLNLRDGETRSRGAVTCPPPGRRRCPHNAAQETRTCIGHGGTKRRGRGR